MPNPHLSKSVWVSDLINLATSSGLVRPVLLATMLLGAALASAQCPLSGDGSTALPYLVSTYVQLDSIGSKCELNASYRLTADIDASASDTENLNRGFKPIGSSALPFKGKFHGGGFAISHLHIVDSIDNDVGLFGVIDSATIDSLRVVNSNISGWVANDSGSVGIIAGTIRSGAIDWCQVSNDTSNGLNDSSSVGGLAGTNSGSITNSKAVSVVSVGKKFSYVGGIAGRNLGTLRACRVSGVPTGSDSSSVGGIVGYNNGHLALDTSSAVVTSTGSRVYAGGIAGFDDTAGTIDSVWGIGSVNGTGTNSQLGGLVGRLDGALTGSHSQAVVTSNGDGVFSGGLAGSVRGNGTISSSSATGSILGTGYAASVGGLVGFCGGTSPRIGSSWASGFVSGAKNANVGGVVGWNDSSGTVSMCHATGSTTSGEAGNVGGVVGRNAGTIDRNYATGAVSTSGACTDGCNTAGGVVGWNEKGIVSRSYATGSVFGSSPDRIWVGGVAGYNQATLSGVYATGRIDSAVVGVSHLGGVAGQSMGIVFDAYWNVQTSGRSQGLGANSTTSSPGSPDSAQGLTTSQMQDSANFQGFGFGPDSAWKIAQHRSYPALKGLVNAPFAIPDTLYTTSSFATSQLLTNDFYLEAGSPPLVAVIDTMYGEDLMIFNGDTVGAKDSLVYRVGAVVSPGDTLWGGEALAKVQKVSFALALGTDSVHTYKDTPIVVSGTATPSSLLVAYSSQDTSVVGVAGSTLSFRKVGTTQITATLGNLTSSGFLRVAPKTLTISGAAAQNKVYDGTTAATVTGGILADTIVGDVVILHVGAATFADKHVGIGKTVSVAASSLSGAAAGNYTLTPLSGLIANIVPDTVHVTALADSAEIGQPDPDFAYTQTGLIVGDSLSGKLSRFTPTNMNIASYPITLGSLTAGPDYAIAFTSAPFKIIPGPTVALAVRSGQHPTSHELAANIGRPFAAPAIGAGRPELGPGTAPGTENALIVNLVLPAAGSVAVSVYDNLGSLVISFARDISRMDLDLLQPTGDGRWILPVSWNLRSGNGIAVPTGVYLWKIDIQTTDGQKLQTVKKLGVRAAR